MKILIFLFLLPSKIVHKLRVFYFKIILGSFGRGSILYSGVIISNPKQVFIGEYVSIAPDVRLQASSQGSIAIGDH